MKIKKTNKNIITKLAPGCFGHRREKMKKRTTRLRKKYAPLSFAKLTIVDGIMFLETNSIWSSIELFYNGNRPTFVNILPAGCFIRIKNNKIYIRSIYGIPLIMGKLLKYYGDFRPTRCSVSGMVGGRLDAEIVNNDGDVAVSRLKTHVDKMDDILYEDDDQITQSGSSIIRPILNDDCVKGLKSNNKTYKGYYHYWPREKVAMTGAYPHTESVPIGILSGRKGGDLKKAKNKMQKFIKFNTAKRKNLTPRKIDYTKYPGIVKDWKRETGLLMNRAQSVHEGDELKLLGKIDWAKMKRKAYKRIIKEDIKSSSSGGLTGSSVTEGDVAEPQT